MRMVDADALIEYFEGLARSLANARCFSAADAIQGAAEKVLNAPAIDADAYFDAVDRIKPCPKCRYQIFGGEPVRHGEWIDEIEPNAVTASGREVHVFRCSACDFTWANKTAVLHYFKHCPNCGAKMDLEVQDG